MRRLAVISILFLLSLPAFAGALHREEYDVPCGVLWPAVKDALANSGRFTARKFDDRNMVAEYSIGAGRKTHDGTVTLTGNGQGCGLEMESSIAAIYGSDPAKVKQQVGLSLEKVKSGAAMAPAVVTAPSGAALTGRAANQTPATSEARSAVDKHSGAKLIVSSNPDGAEIEIDRKAAGNTPLTVPLSHGEHWVTLRKDGYQLWRRRIKIEGSPLELNAELLPAKEKAHWF
jgi:hypothetical protein